MDYTVFTHTYKRGPQYAIKLDVIMPPEPPDWVPVVVYIHGGALIWGTRDSSGPAKQEKIAAILEAKMAYVSIDYRLAPETRLPEILSDIRDALRWVREEGVGLYGFDTTRVTVMGASAGGYLALYSGMLPNRPNAIVSFYGYGDILGDWYAQPSAHYLQAPLVSQEEADGYRMEGRPTHAGEEGRVRLYLRTRQTGTWASVVSGVEASRVVQALRDYCPIRNIDVHYPPTLLLHGSADTDVPVEQSIQMHAALENAGVPAQLHIVPGAGHAFDNAWRNTPEEFGRVIAFLQETYR